MISLLKSQSEDFVIECPMCRSVKKIKKTYFKDKKKQKVLSFWCTCGNRFHKKIIRKNFNEIDLISAIANFDLEVLWHKIKPLLFFFGSGNENEKISLA
jgi:transcription elongation factor Elf1